MDLPVQSQPTSPAKAIRAFCLECCKESAQEVKLCPAAECPLHPFRMGKNPFRKTKALTEEQKQKMAEGRERFNLSKSIDNQCDSEKVYHGSIKTYPTPTFEEIMLSNGKYPTYGNFPEEGVGS